MSRRGWKPRNSISILEQARPLSPALFCILLQLSDSYVALVHRYFSSIFNLSVDRDGGFGNCLVQAAFDSWDAMFLLLISRDAIRLGSQARNLGIPNIFTE